MKRWYWCAVCKHSTLWFNDQCPDCGADMTEEGKEDNG